MRSRDSDAPPVARDAAAQTSSGVRPRRIGFEGKHVTNHRADTQAAPRGARSTADANGRGV
jgi:hypothetical protein